MEKLTYFNCINLANELANFLTFQQGKEILELFAESAVLELPQKEKCIERGAMSQFFQELWTDSSAVYLVNSPQVCVDIETGKGSFFMDVFYLDSNKKMAALGGSRLDLLFCLADGIPKIQHGVWYDMLTLLPEPCGDNRVKEVSAHVKREARKCPADQDCLAIRQILTEKSHSRTSVVPLGLSLIFNMVFQAVGDYICAEYITLDLCEDLSGKELLPSLSLRSSQFVKSGFRWKAMEEKQRLFLTLNKMRDSSLNPPQAAEMIWQNRKQKISIPVHAPSVRDAVIVENMAAEWVSAIRTGDAHVFYESCLQKDAEDLMVHVIRPVKGIEGFFEQCRLMIEMDKKQPKKQGNHILSTPLLHQESEGEITAMWLDFGWTMLAGVFGIEAEVNPVLPAVGRYTMKFRNTKEGWRVFYLQWGPLSQLGNWRFCSSESIGWASSPVKKRWPSLQESYRGYDDMGVNEYQTNAMMQYM